MGLYKRGAEFGKTEFMISLAISAWPDGLLITMEGYHHRVEGDQLIRIKEIQDEVHDQDPEPYRRQ